MSQTTPIILGRGGETRRAAWDQWAVLAPERMRARAPPEWYQRHGSRGENDDLTKTEVTRQGLARGSAADGARPLDARDTATDPPWPAQGAAVVTRRRLGAERDTGEPDQRRRRDGQHRPAPAVRICSPYDTGARYSTQREVDGVGYKVHLTETWDEAMPHLIAYVATTPAMTSDHYRVEGVHVSLAGRDGLPDEHRGDQGDTDSQGLIDSQRGYGVTIGGPVADDPSWRRRGLRQGELRRPRAAPRGDSPGGPTEPLPVAQLLPAEGRGFEAPFARRDGTPGPFRSRCTQATTEPRILGLPARQTHEAWLAARRRQTTQEFRAHYAARARGERTPPPAIRLRGVPRCPSIGLANAHRQQVLTAGASDRVRLSQGWAGPPPAGTRGSRFAALKPAA